MIKYIKIVILFSLFISAPRFADGQITIKQEINPETRPIELKQDESLVSPQIVRPEYMTQGMILAERRRLRKERNLFTMKIDAKINFTQFGNWAKGGDNTFSGLLALEAEHRYKKERLSFTTKFDTRFGVDIIDTITFKSQDYFNLNHQTSWNISKNWSLSGTANLRSQYMKGYKSRKDKTLVSDFMSPGTLDLSLGFSYKPKYWNVTISPITGKMLFVLSDTLSRKGINGVEMGKHFKPMVGSSLDIEFNRKFAKDVIGFRTVIKSFWNFTLDPTTNWENWLDIYATKWLKTSFYCYIIYDKEANVPKKDDGKYVQWNSSIGLSLTFSLKSKK